MEEFHPNFSFPSLSCDIPSPEEIEKEMPLTEGQSQFIWQSRQQLQNILKKRDPRQFIIVGPCSIHDVDAAIEYAGKFKILAEEVSDQFFLVMRTYLEKPRSILGWKGLLYDPDLDGSYHIEKGIRLSRALLSKLTNMKVPVACELLEINTHHYYHDFLSWGCIGARTCLSPPHRQLAAVLPLPIGFKNTIDGNSENAMRAILSAKAPHVFLGLSKKGSLTRIKGKGNSYCHIVLRGGQDGPNYAPLFVTEISEKCKRAHVIDKIVIDCSHDNCEKNHSKQIDVFQEVMELTQSSDYPLAGIMLESNLFSGAQPLTNSLRYGVSITDPCLDWETTEALIKEAYYISKSRIFCLK